MSKSELIVYLENRVRHLKADSKITYISRDSYLATVARMHEAQLMLTMLK